MGPYFLIGAIMQSIVKATSLHHQLPPRVLSRRCFLGAAATALAPASFLHGAERKRPKVAAIFTVFHHRSHAHVLLENFLRPYLFNGKPINPGVEVVAFYADQFPANDMARAVSRQFKIPLYKTIKEALCLGGKELAVNGVLSIGEQGKYPINKLGQVEYPRKRFFDEIVAVMRDVRRFVPLFNDKHLSYRWDWATEMYDVTRKRGIPFMAGSSVPLAQRIPALEVPAGTVIEEIVAIHGGPLEIYDFHGLEMVQSLVEFRNGGETGIAAVQFLRGDALWKAAKAGRWSLALAEAALAAEFGKKRSPSQRIQGEPDIEPHGVLVTYKDGLRATVLKIGKKSTRWNVGVKLKGQSKIQAARYYTGPWGNRNLFKALAHAIQHHLIHGKSPYPVERTLLTTGILEAAMRSRFSSGKSMTTPHLQFGYAARDFRAFREMGATWKIITEEMPEPKGINPGMPKQ
jgi:hypothetical protein